MLSKVKVEVNDLNIDKLIKKIYKSGIVVQNLTRNGYKNLELEIDAKYDKKLKEIVKNYNHSSKTIGLINFKSFFIKNLAFFLCIPVLFFALYFSKQYLWKIEVYGNSHLTKSDIVSVLEDNDIIVGKKIQYTSDDIERILLENIDRVAQCSAIIKGTSIVINLSEKLVYENKEFEPIIAKRSGVIKEIDVKNGTSYIKVGDFVHEGEILVYPFMLDSFGARVNVEPKACIKAEIQIVSNLAVPKEEKILERTGNFYIEKVYSLYSLKFNKQKTKKPFDIYECCVYNKIVSNILPVNQEKTVYYELEQKTITHNFEQEKEALFSRCKDKAYENIIAYEKMISATTDSVEINDVLYVNTNLVLYAIIS